eukprot:CAMPEP_0201542784 /NCGR_PEP_ID=MMETSP0161_2-20130828/72222_1 /ASSEMBLY_ACC=CAM_ASM_000251 /TAXON_ID=180227 /ORGANISM="Neoparamoeba aestuarina, Strain SoJaBio B1-5/56/2" /LENGTH=102 /DNA_ID=CAMNT_0047950463 /DNA_START=716 /DNA_END=1024 /DNA_ORIENTATION=+
MDLSEWNGVRLNDADEVTCIRWIFLRLKGSLALQWLPSTVTQCALTNIDYSSECMTGTLDLTSLPESLIYLKLTGNHFEGEIALTSLPKKMESLDLSDNRLC